MRAGSVAVVLISSSLCLAGSLAAVRGAPPATGRAAPGPASEPDFVVVEARRQTPQLAAYAQVEPIADVPVAAAEAGVLTGLRVRPGTRVQAGEPLARLGGPAIASLLAQSELALHSATDQMKTAEKSLAIEQQQLPVHLSTRQAVQQAQNAVTQSRAAVQNAQTKLRAVRQMTTITAPASGTVLALSSASGALVSAGQTLLTLQPAGGLWLRAVVYGTDRSQVHIGMRGSFMPADGTPARPVRVVAIPGTLQPGGGAAIALEPAAASVRWFSGEAGTVALLLPSQSLVEVPTRALILDQGQWWVLVYTAQGNRPRQVIPGPAEGWNTWIESGLAPGDRVVVNNAYLLFHAGIASQFQLPD